MRTHVDACLVNHCRGWEQALNRLDEFFGTTVLGSFGAPRRSPAKVEPPNRVRGQVFVSTHLQNCKASLTPPGAVLRRASLSALDVGSCERYALPLWQCEVGSAMFWRGPRRGALRHRALNACREEINSLDAS